MDFEMNTNPVTYLQCMMFINIAMMFAFDMCETCSQNPLTHVWFFTLTDIVLNTLFIILYVASTYLEIQYRQPSALSDQPSNLKAMVDLSAFVTSAGPVVGGAPNPMAPIVVTAPQGYKAASIDDGVELSLDTLAVQLPTTGARSLQFRVTSGTMSVNISGQCYWSNGNYAGNYSALYWSGNTLNTTYQQIFTWSFPWANDKAVYSVMDLTNRRYYRVTLIIGPGYKKNFIIMERLV